MQPETNADYSEFFSNETLTKELYDRAMDAAHTSYRAREAFDTKLNAAPTATPTDHLRKGLGYLALSKYSDALAHLEKAADDGLKFYAAAEALTALGRYDKARTALAAAAEKGWDPLVCDMWTAELFVRENDLDAARKLVKKNEGRGADRGEWYYAQALIAEAELDRQTACDMFEKALKLSADLPRVMFRAAYLYDLVGDEDKAIELYKQLTARPRTHVNALINMAVIHEDRGDYERAAHCLRRVLKGFPNHRRARQFL
ncbi:MAG: tetratricopeptide repeat protein, partial [Phycisphaerae bacterium]